VGRGQGADDVFGRLVGCVHGAGFSRIPAARTT
jgi:hypothetical protein